MADIDRMLRSELAIQSDLWPLSDDADDTADWHALSASFDPFDGDSAIGLFSTPSASDFIPQPTVHLSDLIIPAFQIPPSPARPSDTPTDVYSQTDPSEDMSSDDYDLAYPSDPDFLPSPPSANPSLFSVPGPDLHVRPSRRGSRTMTKVPVPIPNLTKKSRGRKVPTSDGEPIHAASKDKAKKGLRTYTCHADGCRKCFVRGEHLKRHIRSIHTDEKPWLCTYEKCTRAFSRRDNLNQHLRIHKLQLGDD